MKKLIVLTLLFLGIGIQMNAQSAPGQMPPLTLEDYFSPSTAVPAGPDAKGFVQRWTLLEPIGKPGLNSNAAFNDSYLRKEFATVYFKDQNTMVPKDGQTVTLADKTKLKWHCLDSKKYNVKLYRFASGLGLRPTEGVFMAVTVINVDKDVTVRMAVGSNSGSIWYVLRKKSDDAAQASSGQKKGGNSDGSGNQQNKKNKNDYSNLSKKERKERRRKEEEARNKAKITV